MSKLKGIDLRSSEERRLKPNANNIINIQDENCNYRDTFKITNSNKGGFMKIKSQSPYLSMNPTYFNTIDRDLGTSGK
jgi:hypothetical protein